MSEKAVFKAGQYWAAKYEGTNGDLILGKVKSVRHSGEIVLTNLLSGKTSTKKAKVLLVRNKRVSAVQSKEILKEYLNVYKKTKSKTTAKAAARRKAIDTQTYGGRKEKPRPKQTPFDVLQRETKHCRDDLKEIAEGMTQHERRQLRSVIIDMLELTDKGL